MTTTIVIILIYFLFTIFQCNAMEHDDEYCSHHECTDEIVVQLSRKDSWMVERIAEKHGYHNLGHVGGLRDYYLFKRKDGRRKKREIFAPLVEDNEIVWAEPQIAKKRVKRDSIRDTQKLQVNTTTSLVPPNLPWPDPLYSKQWYLLGGAAGGNDMKVKEVWEMGYSGKGVVTSILDDGLERRHPDLADNYDPLASKDINGNDDDPTPRDNGDNKHGTRCAGEVAAIAGNEWCGVGIAYNSKIGGVRMLDGPVSDRVEGAALSLNQDHIDIYSASWGPDDDGQTVDGPGRLAKEAFFHGAIKGRQGKGNIFVWASGNGGGSQDSCSCDGYQTSIYTMSVSSASYTNEPPWYLEECPSTFATTYSSGSYGQAAIVSTDMPDSCTDQHTGTSASAPIAAGIIALALEANPNLTWRDLQHLLVRTSNSKPLLFNSGWVKNGVGRMVSNKFGYGLMDAEALVKAALTWKTVPPQLSCTYVYQQTEPKSLSGKFSYNLTLDVGDCLQGRPIRYLEHVQPVISVKFKRRGDLLLTLYSPLGTKSNLLPRRSRDSSTLGFTKWPFMSVQQWGENPRGSWILNVENGGPEDNTGLFQEWSMTFYGTYEPVQSDDFPLDDSPNSTNKPKLNENCHKECSIDGCYVAQSAQDCVSCKNLKQVTSDSGQTFLCVSKCRDGFYANDAIGQCVPCFAGCATCSGPEYCDSCPNNLYLVDMDEEYFYHGKCLSDCPKGFVKEENAVNGRRCVSICDSTSCLSCKDNQKCNYCKENFFITPIGECVLQCINGFYGNVSTRKCEKCMDKCEACSKFDICDTCASGYDWDHFKSRCSISVLKSCTESKDCPAGQYCESTSLTCHGCHNDCAECFGPEFDQCFTCKNGQPLDERTRQCSLCKHGQYYDTMSGRCFDCHKSCSLCYGSGPDQCFECITGYKSYGRTCKPCCSSSQFHDGSSCVRCVDQSEVTNTQLTLAAKVVIGIIVGFALCLLSIGILMFISKNVNCPNFGKKESSGVSVRYSTRNDGFIPDG